MESLISTASNPEMWVAFLSLTALEIVLGIDNIVFIAVVTSKLPASQQAFAYRVGLGGALLTRIALLLAISWVMGLTTPLFEIFGKEISGRDLILMIGGLFLIAKSSNEIYHNVESQEQHDAQKQVAGMFGTIVQIMLLDVIFSLDSVITAVGMVDEIGVMIVAVITAVLVMLVFAKRVGDFVNQHPSVKVLALSFLLLIGVLLTAESLDQHLDKRYIYSAMGFALFVEFLNMRLRKNQEQKRAEIRL